MDTITPETAPAQPVVPPAAAEPAARPNFRAFDESETAKALGRAPARPEAPAKPAAAPVVDTDEAPALDAKGEPILEDGKPLSKRQHHANERIRRAVEAGISEERQKREALERKLADIEARSAPAEPAKPPAAAAPATEDKEPVLDDFLDQPDPYLALTKALVKFERAQERKAEATEREQQTAATRVMEQAQKDFTGYQARETAFKATIPDFDTRTLGFRQVLDMRMPLDRAIITSEVAPQLILHLAEHHEEVRRIGALAQSDLTSALREIVKLEAQFTAAAAASTQPAEPPVKHVTSAPSPGTFLGSQPAPAADAGKAAVARKDFRAFDEEETTKELARRKRR